MTTLDTRKVPLMSRFRTAWNVLRDRNQDDEYVYISAGVGSTSPRHKKSLTRGTEKSIVAAAYNRCSIDVANIPIRHVRVDEKGNFVETIKSGLNNCLTSSANIDQTGFVLVRDIVTSMFDEGHVAVVPVDVSVNLDRNDSFDILSLRTGQILEWFPRRVKLRVYNDSPNSGDYEDIIMDKEKVAIIENPLYEIMNEPNSTLKRLIAKLNLLDAIDQQSGSGKLDLIIQLPWAIKSDAKQLQAEKRLKSITDQLKDSPFGIAYTDATENIVQLNRPAENKLLDQITYLTRMLYGQLGLSENVFNGTADEAEMLNYYSRTIYPIMKSIVMEFKRKFLTPTAITQGQDVGYFRDPFAFVTSSALADIADKFTRNEILSSNEFRGIIGFQPSDDPRADELRNKNLNAPDETTTNNQKEK